MIIDIDELSSAVMNELNNWSEEKSKKINDHVKKRGKEMVEAIKNDSVPALPQYFLPAVSYLLSECPHHYC